MSSNTVEEEHITCTDDMKNLHITCTEVQVVGVCANCGTEGSDMNICNKCKDAKYCNAACKKKHRSKHKKKCERRVAEMHDEALFKQPPKKEDCPICMLLLPSLNTGSRYKACCGKDICSGCIHAVKLRDKGVGLCPFCRTPTPTSEKEEVKRTKKRIEAGDATAMFNLGSCYYEGLYGGLQRDYEKALKLWHRAAELGCAVACHNIGHAYRTGRGVERDELKANHYYELAAIGGYATARRNLGNSEFRAGNWDRALKHYLIAAGDGNNKSVKMIQKLYMGGDATKEDYSKALQTYQSYFDEIKSDQRDKAAAVDDTYKYY